MLISYIGFSQYDIATNNGQTINACTGTFFDSGGAGDYTSSENYTITFCGDLPGAQIILDFVMFDTESSFDDLTIYDGTSTADPLIGTYDGTSLNGNIVQSGSGCLHLVWSSDGSVTYPGWEANISCTFPCQQFDANITTCSEPYVNGDTVAVCQGQPITFTATGDYPNTGVNYPQSDATTVFTWDFGDGSPVETGASVTHTFPDGGGYFVVLTAEDVAGCDNSNHEVNAVMVSTSPTFVGTNIAQDTICLGETVNLSGFTQTEIWEQTVPPPFAEETFLPDNSSGFYQTAITYEIFGPGQTLDDVNDLLSVCVTMEHSYLGDLTIQLFCPNGQSVDFIVYPNGCGGTYLGEPIDNDSDLNPGVGYEYCWMPTSTNGTFGAGCGTGTLPAGDYEAETPWSDLLGCPLNGDWEIYIFDNLSSDNGYIFEWMINFDPSIIPTNLWEFQNTHQTTDMQWTGDNITVDNDDIAIAEPTSDGYVSYTFTSIDDFGCPYDTSMTVFVLPAGSPGCCAMPTADAGDDDEICGLTYNLQGVMFDITNTGVWTFAGPGSAGFSDINSPTSTVTVTTYGMYTFTWTETNSIACENSNDAKITFYEIPTSTFTTTDIMCFSETSTITYTGTGGVGATYNWDFDGATTSPTGQGPHNISWDISGTHTITLTVTENTCISTQTTIDLLNPELLIVNSDAGNIDCPGDFSSVSFDIQGGIPNYTYTWSPTTPVDLNNVVPGSYEVTITDNNGCIDSTSFTIENIDDLIYLETHEDLTCFENNTGSIDITFGGGTLPYDYIWSGPSFTSTDEDVSNLDAGTYNVTITDDGGCTITDEIILDEPEILNVTVINTINPSCYLGTDGEIEVLVNGGTLPYTYNWDSGIGSNVETGLGDGQVNLQVTDDNGCTSNITTTLNEPDELLSNISGTDVSCNGGIDGTIILDVTGGTLPYNYIYDPILPNTNIHNSVGADNYNVTIIDAQGCIIYNSIIISEPLLPLNITFNQVNMSCNGDNIGSIDIEVTGGTTPYNYNWSNSLETPDLYNLISGTYTITVTDDMGCISIETIEITEPNEVVLVVEPDRYICIGETTTINSSTTGGIPPYTYEWNNGIFTSSNTISPTETTIYDLIVTDGNGCIDYGTSSVIVYPTLKLELEISDDIVCLGDPIAITASTLGGNGGPYYLTHNGEYIITPYIIYPNESQTYSISLNDMCETPQVTEQISVVVIDQFVVNLSANILSGCQPLEVEFISHCDLDSITYDWDFGDINSNFSYISDPVHTFDNDGQFDISLTITDKHGCTATETIENYINVYPLPESKFYANPVIASILKPIISFDNYSTHIHDSYWFFDDKDSSNIFEPIHRYNDIGTYNVILVIETIHGCLDTSYQDITIMDEYTFYAPTAFSPNNDGMNDIFFVSGYGIEEENFTLTIFDRWGEIVYKTDKYDIDNPKLYGWNGNVKKGTNFKTDTYTWLVRYVDKRGIGHEETGSVTIVR